MFQYFLYWILLNKQTNFSLYFFFIRITCFIAKAWFLALNRVTFLLSWFFHHGHYTGWPFLSLFLEVLPFSKTAFNLVAIETSFLTDKPYTVNSAQVEVVEVDLSPKSKFFKRLFVFYPS